MRKYLDKSVYEAAQERIAYCFDRFDNVLVSFSGGKDSGVCLEMCYRYAEEHGLLDRLAYYHLDYEAQYQATTDYVAETFERLDGCRRYWLCLPVGASCGCRMDSDTWVPWRAADRAIWVRDMPDLPYVMNEANCPFPVVEGKKDYDVQDDFDRWFAAEYGSTALVIGIRCQESHERTKLVTSMNGSIRKHDGLCWLTDDAGCGLLHRAYIVYDWQVEDVWTYNAKSAAPYNRLYDLYHMAGLKPSQMRVANPFHSCGTDNLRLYKAIDPDTWGRMVGRVNGVSFASIYGGTTAMGWRGIRLPEGHTWHSYCMFLLSTLPDDVADHYRRIFTTSLEYWTDKGGFVAEDVMPELEGADYDDLGPSERYEGQRKVRFAEYPDDMDTKSFAALPSWKRACVCILKNDYNCKYMGFSQTREQYRRRKEVMEKYASLL